ncbi:MAG: Imm26 family immunity protein [Anaerolineales bacterium]|jgi:hypothetical protein
MRKQIVSVGDVFEIPLSGGRKAFGHYVHADKQWGPQIQIYDLLVNESKEINPIILLERSFLFPPIITGLVAAVRTGMWKVIGNFPREDYEYPKFIQATYDSRTGKPGFWFLWDESKKIKLGKKLPNKYKQLEFLVVWSPHDIVARIETGEIPYPYKDLIEKNKFEPRHNKKINNDVNKN